MHTNESTAAQDLTTRAYYCPQAEQSHIPGLRAAGNRFSASAARGSESSTHSTGATGALNKRPLRDLSMIYRLWTGIRLEEAMRWHEAWAHPCAPVVGSNLHEKYTQNGGS